MMPSWQEASAITTEFRGVIFGVIDCNTHRNLCSDFSVWSYPSVFAYRDASGTPTPFSGNIFSPKAIQEFVNITLHPPVVELDPILFEKDIIQSEEDMWVVDFFAPWCGACQTFAPSFAFAASAMRGAVRFGSVDCVKHKPFCQKQNIRFVNWQNSFAC